MAQKTIHGPYNMGKNVLVKSKSNLKISKSLIIPESNVKKTKSKDDLCSNCGIRAKGPGFHFLCRYCFRKAGDEPVYSINFNTIGGDIFFTKISG